MSTSSQKNGPANDGKAVRAVFLSSAAGTDMSVIRKILEGEGVRVLSDQDVEPGQTIRESLILGMLKADVVIAVLGERRENANVFYELGMADAMKKPVLLVSTGVLVPVSDIALYPNIRARSDDEEALRFGLSHFLRAPHHSTKPEPDLATTKPLGDRVDAFLDQLRSDPHIREDVLVGIIAAAIRDSGVETQATVSPRFADEDSSADIAVWSDELTALVGSPIPIEIRSMLLAERDADGAANNLMRAVAAARARWGLILFLKANQDALRALTKYPVLAMSVGDFLEGLRNRSFAKVVTDLRNRTVHGGRFDA